MKKGLDRATICEEYTLAEIEAKITIYTDALENAIIKMYDKDTGQGRQKVESADIDKIESLLAVFIRAKAWCTGNAGTNITSANFQGTRRSGL